MLFLDMDPLLSIDHHSTIISRSYPQQQNNMATQDPPAQFKATWSPSKTQALNPANLQLSKQPRAWDRKACNPAAGRNLVRKVWKRYDLRTPPQRQNSQHSNVEGSNGGHTHAEKVVKRARVQDASEETRVSYRATKLERRKSRGHNSERLVPDTAFG